jgi:hypothetical protein
LADKLTQRLLDSSFQYVQGKHAFETAITAAREWLVAGLRRLLQVDYFVMSA